MEILEKMLHVEAEAKQIVEHANLEATEIRNKAREDAQQLIIDGKKGIQERLQQEIARLEEEAAARKQTILQHTETRIAELEHLAQDRIDRVVETVMQKLLEQHIT